MYRNSHAGTQNLTAFGMYHVAQRLPFYRPDRDSSAPRRWNPCTEMRKIRCVQNACSSPAPSAYVRDTIWHPTGDARRRGGDGRHRCGLADRRASPRRSAPAREQRYIPKAHRCVRICRSGASARGNDAGQTHPIRRGVEERSTDVEACIPRIGNGNRTDLALLDGRGSRCPAPGARSGARVHSGARFVPRLSRNVRLPALQIPRTAALRFGVTLGGAWELR
ncbi:hypothetical protein C8Q77DRAFT_331405 [Trametes polyzona]|nr:hypothetical protein C8Q77DRAFT_331405 [Trametes polyzona]